MTVLKIHRAELKDLEAITDIYNEAVRNTTATFDTKEKTAAQQREWYDKHDEKHPVIVACEGDITIGWASLSAYSDRCAYAATAEASVYVKPDWRGKGVGRKLSVKVLEEGKKTGLHTVILRIAEGNDASIKLAETLGFKQIGVMEEVGTKFGKVLDVILMQLIYK
jgi:L-amino acid N-acyltransferase YncA